MLINPLQIVPDSSAVLGWRRSFAAATHRIDTSWGQRQEGFETNVTFPVGAKVVHISKPLAPMEAEVPQHDPPRRCPIAAVLLAMNMEAVQVLVTPGKQDLQDGMQVCQGGRTVEQHPTPDERTDAAQNDPQLIDAERCSHGSHALRVAQRLGSLKGSPRYLALSYKDELRQALA